MSAGNKYNIYQFNIATSLLAVLNHNDPQDTDFVIAKYLLENIKQLPDLSIYQVADDCFVSRSSVQRFIKMLGFESFTALKDNAADVKRHSQSFVQYTDHADYQAYLKNQMIAMIDNVNEMAGLQNINEIAQRIHDAGTVVMISAEGSCGAVHTFQQSLVLTGKLIRVITNTSNDKELLAGLSERDLVLTCSASGNFALAINENIRPIKAHKILVTLNRTLVFEPTYDQIFYLSKEFMPSSRQIVPSTNIYTRYGITYFLDLLYHVYFSMYQTEC